MATATWVCMNCGKQVYRSSTSNYPPSSTQGGKCPASPSGKHVYIRQM